MKAATAIAPARPFRETGTPEPFRMFQNRLNRLFDFPFNMLGPLAPLAEEALPLAAWVPPCDIFETNKEIVLKLDLPEVKKEEVYVSFEGNVLMIRGERKFEEETERENYHRVERDYGEFLRSFTLPAFIDSKKITAEFKEGVLTVKLPKLEEAKPKMIEVR